MVRRSRLVLAAATLSALCGASPAASQDAPAAEALFDLGVKELTAGHYDKACPPIAESLRLDPRPGTLFTLAECEAKLGRIATAETHYRDYLALYAKMTPEQQESHRKREGIARAQHAALAPAVPQLSISLAAGAPAGTVVRRDGAVVPEAALGVALPIDPGEHVVSTEAPGRLPGEVRVTLAAGEKKAVVAEVNKAAPAMGADLGPRAPSPASTGTGSRQRVAAYVVGGVGLAALSLGAVMGGLTLSKKATIDQDCGVNGVPTACRTTAGASAGQSAETTGLVSTIGFGVGLAGLATAVVLWVTAPRAAKTATGLRPSVSAVGTTGAVIGAWRSW
jgi:hypothetical protein